MKRLKAVIATVFIASAIHAANTVSVPQSVTITNTPMILLPAIQPTSYSNWVSNVTVAANVYIGAYTNVVSDTGKTNYALRFWFALRGGTNSVLLTQPPLNVVTDTYDGAVIWRPVPATRAKAILFNTGASATYLGFNRDAVAAKGWYVAPSGGSYLTSSSLGDGPGIESWQGEVKGCTAGTDLTNVITIQEFPR